MNLLLKSLQPYLWKYRWLLLWGILFIIISNIFSIYPGRVVEAALDLVADLLRLRHLVAGFAAESLIMPMISSALLLFGIIVILAALIRGIFLFLVRQTLIVMSRHMEYDQKNELFDRYQLYSLSILRRRQTGDLMARITEDVAAVRMFTGPGIMYSITTLTLFVMVMATMLLINVELTLWVLAPMPLLALAIYIVHSIINKRSEETQNQLSTISSFTQEAYSGVRLIKAYAREENFDKRFSLESARYRQKALRLARVESLFFPVILLLIGISTLFAVYIGGKKVIEGTLTIGVIAEFVLYINLLTWPVASLGWITSMIQRAAASQKRINELLDLTSEIKFPASSAVVSTASLQFDHVSYTYPDTGIEALKDVSFEVPSGSVLGIVGTTGCGKTTLANLVLRLMDVSQGQILLDETPIEQFTQQALRGAMGYVPQDVFLFSDTIANNIAFGRKDASQDEIEAAARFAGVYEDIMEFPEGFETMVGERGVTLSGGQKQRVSIARAYLLKPAILILDDSLSAVDTGTEARILANIRNSLHESAYKPTLILISHRISTVEQANQILVMDEGHILERGTHQSLVAQNGAYAELNRKQLLEAEIVKI